MATEPTTPTPRLSILETPVPTLPLNGIPSPRVIETPASAIRRAGRCAAAVIETMIENVSSAGESNLSPADVQQLTALTHALDVSTATIASNLAARYEPDDEHDKLIERAVHRALDQVWEILGACLGHRVGSPMRWHPDAPALAAVMTDVARRWIDDTLGDAEAGLRPCQVMEVASPADFAAVAAREDGQL